MKVVGLAQPRSQDFSSPRVAPTLAGEKPWERGWVLVLIVGMAVVVVVVVTVVDVVVVVMVLAVIVAVVHGKKNPCFPVILPKA